MIETKNNPGPEAETATGDVETKGFLLMCDTASLSFDAGQKLRATHLVREHFNKRYGENDPQVREYFPNGLDLNLGAIFERNFTKGAIMLGANCDFTHFGFQNELASESLHSNRRGVKADEIRLKLVERYVCEAFSDLRELGLLYPRKSMPLPTSEFGKLWLRIHGNWPEFTAEVSGQITNSGRAALCEWLEQRQHDSTVVHPKPRPDAA
jgi:hypothetical protein